MKQAVDTAKTIKKKEKDFFRNLKKAYETQTKKAFCRN